VSSAIFTDIFIVGFSPCMFYEIIIKLCRKSNATETWTFRCLIFGLDMEVTGLLRLGVSCSTGYKVCFNEAGAAVLTLVAVDA
jgi:hypothetical protein